MRVPIVLPAVGVLLAVGVLTGCAARVSVPVAPDADDPACATLVLALPQRLAGLPGLRTTSQATAAWGEARSAVVLRCGVEPPGPTTDQCVTADDGTTSVDWVAVPGPAGPDGSSPWTFTTYGRVPAVEVRVPAAVTATRSTSFLLELGPAIATVEATRRCL